MRQRVKWLSYWLFIALSRFAHQSRELVSWLTSLASSGTIDDTDAQLDHDSLDWVHSAPLDGWELMYSPNNQFTCSQWAAHSYKFKCKLFTVTCWLKASLTNQFICATSLLSAHSRSHCLTLSPFQSYHNSNHLEVPLSTSTPLLRQLILTSFTLTLSIWLTFESLKSLQLFLSRTHRFTKFQVSLSFSSLRARCDRVNVGTSRQETERGEQVIWARNNEREWPRVDYFFSLHLLVSFNPAARALIIGRSFYLLKFRLTVN